MNSLLEIRPLRGLLTKKGLLVVGNNYTRFFLAALSLTYEIHPCASIDHLEHNNSKHPYS